MQQYLNTLPAFQHPSNSQLPSAYSDLSRQRRSNPPGFRANVEWWKNILTEATWESGEDRLVLHLDERLKSAFTVQSVGRPLGLGTVIGELQKTGEVVGLSGFMRGGKPISGPGGSSFIPSAAAVASTLLVKPLGWAFSQLGIGGEGDTDESEDENHWKTHKGDWVVWSNLEKVTTAFLDMHYSGACLSPLDSLFSITAFKTKISPLKLSDLDVQVLLKHLIRDRKLALTSRGLIKLSTDQHDPPSPITQQDDGIISMLTTQIKLEHQISEIEGKIKDRNLKIKILLKSNQKMQALSYLRSRKALQDLLEKRMGSLETISNLLVKVEQAAGDIQLIQAYETSSDTLKAILKDPRLQVERVEDTMRGLEDAMADQNEIEHAIKYGEESARAAAGVEVDDKELQAEMETLEKEEKRIAREAAEQKRLEERIRKEEQRKAEEEPKSKEEQRKAQVLQEKQRFDQEMRSKQAQRTTITEE